MLDTMQWAVGKQQEVFMDSEQNGTMAKLIELNEAITDKYVGLQEGKPVHTHCAAISRLISELSVEQLFSGTYSNSPLHSARIFKDDETMNLIMGKEGVLPPATNGGKASLIQDRFALLDAIAEYDSNRTVEMLDKIGGYKKISPDQNVRRLYKREIENGFHMGIDDLIATVRGRSVQSESPEQPEQNRGHRVK